MIGSTILHYKILEKLGEGGMGVVYKAEDTKLERLVAIKLLPAHLLTSDEDRSRFTREAKAAAALSHPNIATVYEINDYEGKPFIAMEYIEGKTINDLLGKEMFKLKDVISITIQVAEGLKAAHSKNIVHRDIKSGNILLSNDRQAKILDFGLAKTAMSTKLTKLGSTLGTVAYMSPEQVSGEKVDHRTDLWSLGVVIFEMLTGHYPFAGDYDQAIFYNIMNDQPEALTAIRSGIPMSLEWIVNKLLAKDPNERYQNANDLIIDLKAVDIKTSGFTRISQTTVRKQTTNLQDGFKNDSKKKKIVKQIVLPLSFIVVAILAGLISWNLHPEPVKQVRKFQWASDNEFTVISPDGKKIAYSKGDKIWIRFLDRTDPVEIKSNEPVSNIFWSPNSDYVAYFTGIGVYENHKLMKVSVSGVGSTLITQTASNYYPRFWGEDDSILVTTWDNSGKNTLLKVSASGGELKPICGGDSALSNINGDLTHVLGLPDGNSLILSVNYLKGKTQIILQAEGKRKVIYSNSTGNLIERPVYSNNGFILFPLQSQNGSDLWAIPFDVSSMEKTGNIFLIARDADAPSVSDNGILMYTTNRNSINNEQLVLISRIGLIIKQLDILPTRIYGPVFSPNGNSIACSIPDASGNFNIWTYSLLKNTKTQLTYNIPEAYGPSWSPDGKKIIFVSGFVSNINIYLKEINSSLPAKPFINTNYPEEDPFWSSDGRYILYSKKENNQFDLWYLEQGKNNKSQKFFESPYNEFSPKMAPDGKYVVFISDKSGQNETWVTNFPEADHLWQVSFSGANYPLWIKDEIFFVNTRTKELMSVKVKPGPEFDVPQKVISADSAGILLNDDSGPKYTITNDGKNIIAVKTKNNGGSNSKIVLVENWGEEFKNKHE